MAKFHLPRFPFKGGWLGGDSAYSIWLSEGRILWLFGDTFISKVEAQSRRKATMIDNSIAISNGGGIDDFQISYSWRRSPSGEPASFFSMTGVALWPLDGIVYREKLYIALLQVHRGTSGPMDFKPTGVVLAEIANPGEVDPCMWTINYRNLSTPFDIFPGSSVVLYQEYLYLFAFHGAETPLKKISLSRIQLNELANDQPTLEWLLEFDASTGLEVWGEPSTSRAPATLFDGATAEFSVRFNNQLGYWLAIYGGFPGDEITVRSSPTILGPWSKPSGVVSLDRFRRSPNAITYAAKEHSEFSKRLTAEICVSIVTNSLEPNELLSDLEIYLPQALLIPLSAITKNKCQTIAAKGTKKD